jgi:hypothetical protein
MPIYLVQAPPIDVSGYGAIGLLHWPTFNNFVPLVPTARISDFHLYFLLTHFSLSPNVTPGITIVSQIIVLMRCFLAAFI